MGTYVIPGMALVTFFEPAPPAVPVLLVVLALPAVPAAPLVVDELLVPITDWSVPETFLDVAALASAVAAVEMFVETVPSAVAIVWIDPATSDAVLTAELMTLAACVVACVVVAAACVWAVVPVLVEPLVAVRLP